MQSNITFKRTRGIFRYALMVLALFSLFAGKVNAQTYVNGNLNTGATSSNGTAAPAGFTWSEVQTGNGTTGVGANITAGFTVADDFTVPAGPSWTISKITFYAYSTNYVGATSPFVDTRVQIFNTNPSVGSPVPIYGDLTTNRLLATSAAGMYRIPNAAPGTARQLWKIEAAVNTVLAPGTYWIEWAHANGGLSNFSPTSTVVGTTTQPGNNAQQHTIAGNTWANILDGTSNGAQDMPFIIDYSTGACSGTPAPGNTLSTAASVCPGVPFTLSLQNASVGSGITYQWQSGPSATGPWTNIAGATATTYSSTLVTSTYFQCNVTCSASASTGTSTPVQVQATPASGCYCIPGATTCTLDDEILNVKIGGINNSSSGCTGAGYTNYTVSVPAGNIISNALNPMSVQVGPGGTEYVSVWIDYDHSGTFDASEMTLLGSGNGVTINGNVNIPASALSGSTRMRVRVRFNTALTGGQACIGYAYGETEDYTVNITPCVLGVYTTQPVDRSITCGANTTFSVAATGSLLTYQWEYRVNSSSPWINVPNAAPYSGVTTPTLTITTAPDNLNGYQYRTVVGGACTALMNSDFGTLTVNPLIATVNPPAATICNGSIQQLSITNTASAPTTTTFSSGPLTLAIPDNTANGVSNTINVSGIPAGAVITAMSVKFNLAHTYCGDMLINLQAPNTSILALDKYLTGTAAQAGAYPNIGFVNTVISSAGTVALGTAAAQPITGTFRADALNTLPAAFTITNPTGFISNVTNFAALYSVPNGAWTLALADGGPADIGTLTSWSIDITYVAPTLATGVWGPITTPPTIFTDAAATIPYTGTAVTTVYVHPTVSTTYNVVVATATCTTPSLNIPVTVNNPVSGVSTVVNDTTCVNGTATFSVSAAAGNTINYSWEESVDAGLTWAAVTNGGIYSGATSSTLTLTGVDITMNGYMYRAKLTVPTCNALTSNAAMLTVNPNPVVVANAGPYTRLFPGLSTTITAAVSPNPAATYQWYHDGVLVPGATGSTINVDIDGLGDYYVTVNDVNSCNGQSNTVTISDSANDIMFIYPNPTSGRFQIRYYSLPGNTLVRAVTIYDSKGAKVYSKDYGINVPYGKIEVDFSQQPTGVYMVELSDFNGARLKTGRLIKL